jgi:hypothetical protein
VKSNTNDLNLPAVYEDSSPYWTPERLAQIEAQRHLEPKLARLLSDPATEGTRDSVLAFMTGPAAGTRPRLACKVVAPGLHLR